MNMIAAHEPFSYQHDETVAPFAAGEVFTVMDAQCALCARGARWIARNDRNREFTLALLGTSDIVCSSV